MKTIKSETIDIKEVLRMESVKNDLQAAIFLLGGAVYSLDEGIDTFSSDGLAMIQDKLKNSLQEVEKLMNMIECKNKT